MIEKQPPHWLRRLAAWLALAAGCAGLAWDLVRVARGRPAWTPEWLPDGPLAWGAAWVSYALGLPLLAASLRRRWSVVLAPALLAAAVWVLAGNAAGQLLLLPAALLTLASMGVVPAVAVALAALELALVPLRRQLRFAAVVVLAAAALAAAWRAGSLLWEPPWPPLRPAVDAPGVPERDFRLWLFSLHSALNAAVFRLDPSTAGAELDRLEPDYARRLRPGLLRLERELPAREAGHVAALRGDLDRALTLARLGLAGHGAALRLSHRIVHDLDTHLLGSPRSAEYFGASRLLELIRRQRGHLPTLARPRPHDRLRLTLAYLWGLATEGLALTALALWWEGRRHPPAPPPTGTRRDAAGGPP